MIQGVLLNVGSHVVWSASTSVENANNTGDLNTWFSDVNVFKQRKTKIQRIKRVAGVSSEVEALQQRMCDLGFGETYDFLYMPFDLQSEQNKGYAFVHAVFVHSLN